MKAQINLSHVKILIFQLATHRVYIWPVKTYLLLLFRGKHYIMCTADETHHAPSAKMLSSWLYHKE